jgi:hypothetical protein
MFTKCTKKHFVSQTLKEKNTMDSKGRDGTILYQAKRVIKI